MLATYTKTGLSHVSRGKTQHEAVQNIGPLLMTRYDHAMLSSVHVEATKLTPTLTLRSSKC